MVADYAGNSEQESRFSALMHRNMRAKEGLTCGQYRTSERGREWFRGARVSYWWQDAVRAGAPESGR